MCEIDRNKEVFFLISIYRNFPPGKFQAVYLVHAFEARIPVEVSMKSS